MVLEYNQNNLQTILTLIQNNLTPDLLPKKWYERNRLNPTFGHCHNSAGCIYRVFGPKSVKMYRGFDGEIYHWWIQDLNGVLIDITADQYYSVGKQPPYDKGEKASLLGFDYRKRVDKLYERVMSDYNNNQTVLTFT